MTFVALCSPPGWRSLVKLVAMKHGVGVADIIGESRARRICCARHEAIYLVHSHCRTESLKQVGNIFRRDHTTVLSSIKVHLKHLATQKEFPQNEINPPSANNRGCQPETVVISNRSSDQFEATVWAK